MKNNLLSITWLHAAACLLIVLCNAESFAGKLSEVKFSGLAGYGSSIGQLGVFLFFMSSGYLISSLHWNDFAEGKVIPFIKKRLVKILPVYYLFTLITIIFWIIQPAWFPSTTIGPVDNLLSLLFIPSVYIKELGSLTPVLSAGWILCYEMLFYLIFSVGLLLARRAGLTFIFLSVIVLAATSLLLKSDNLWVHFYTNPIMLYFLSGVFCYALQPRLSTPWFHSGYSLLMVGFLVIVSTLLLQGFTQLIVLTLSFFILTFFSFRIGKSSSTGKVLTAVGMASYSIYVCHRLLMGALEEILHFFIPVSSGQIMLYLAMAILLVGSVGVGYLVYWIIERRASVILQVKAG
ncbi:acyltransferase family protein [Erwinia sp.]|uniref:acyltransferase family protein n=1 Tax=Erwinia citreus TaxID=558 RepID=UPI003C761629